MEISQWTLTFWTHSEGQDRQGKGKNNLGGAGERNKNLFPDIQLTVGVKVHTCDKLISELNPLSFIMYRAANFSQNLPVIVRKG